MIISVPCVQRICLFQKKKNWFFFDEIFKFSFPKFFSFQWWCHTNHNWWWFVYNPFLVFSKFIFSGKFLFRIFFFEKKLKPQLSFMIYFHFFFVFLKEFFFLEIFIQDSPRLIKTCTVWCFLFIFFRQAFFRFWHQTKQPKQPSIVFFN